MSNIANEAEDLKCPWGAHKTKLNGLWKERMGYQSRVPLGALKQEAVTSSIAFTLGLFEIHNSVHMLIKPVAWDVHLYTLDVTWIEQQHLSQSRPLLLELLVGETELLQTYLGREHCEEWVHYSTHIQVFDGIVQFKAFVLISAAIAHRWPDTPA